MKSLGIIVQSVISLAIVGGSIFGYFAMGEPEVAKRPPSRNGAPAVQTLPAERHDQDLRIEVDGVVIPFRQVEIAAEVQGRVASKSENCRKGREVRQDDLLIEIDPRDYQLDVKRLEEELQQADAMIRELEVEIQTAENQKELITQQLAIDTRQLERNQRLSSTAAASQSEIDAAMRAELSTRNTLREITDSQHLLRQRLVRMESGKDLVRANLDKAKLALERTMVYSPLDGVIVDESVEQDGYVQAGSSVIVVQDNSQFDVTCKLHMRQMHWLWQSQPANQTAAGDQSTSIAQDGTTREAGESTSQLAAATKLSSSGYDFPEAKAVVRFELEGREYQWSGVLDRFDGAGIDAQTRMVPCRVHIDQPLNVELVAGVAEPDGLIGKVVQPPALMTGMFVKVHIFVTPPMPLVRVPQKAIQPGDIVWCVRDGTLVSRRVRRAVVEGDDVIAYEEKDGLMAGDLVVVSPLASPFDGKSVAEVGR